MQKIILNNSKQILTKNDAPSKNTYHVMNEDIAPSEVTDNVEDERADAFRGIPKLSCLDLP